MKKFYLMLLLITLNSTILFAQIYVTETGAGNKDGTSWANAYDNTQLQQAINEAENATIKQVWIAKGTYKPTESLSSTGFLTDGTTPTTDRDKAFILKADVEIYGGFAGAEVNINDRIGINTTNQTILSGDLNGNGIADVGDCYHVVASRNASLRAVLDGFIIQHGFADGDNGNDRTITEGGETINQKWGGAICLRGDQTGSAFSNLIIRNNKSTAFSGGIYARGSDGYSFNNVRFENNVGGGSGGGLYMYANTAVTTNLTNCTFINNIGVGDGGGGLYYGGDNGSVINITNCTFTNNTHDLYGGAFRLNAGTANITSTTFENGAATSRGGAIYSTGTSILNLNNCTFRNNTSASGGHYYIYSGTGNIINTTFQSGTSTGSGGAIYSSSDGNLTISKTKFYSNTADGSAGALYLGGSATSISTIDNSLFYNNVSKSTTSTTTGGAIYTNPVSSILTILNSTFYANKSASAHGAVSFNNTTGVILNMYNNIFNNNLGNYDFVNEIGTSADVRSGTSANQTYTNNLFQNTIASGGTVTGGIPRRNVINAYYLPAPSEPLFASTNPADINFLYPASNSFAKDKGDKTLFPNADTEKDLLDNSRVYNGIIDLGAIEYSPVLPVKISSFTANLVNNRTQLKWNVGAEDNVNRYEVERSQNGVDFIKVATVSASGSANYQTTDDNPQVGDNYYRLTTTDNDGSRSQYDVVRVVKIASLSVQNVQVYPNPVKGNEVKVSLGNAAAMVYSYKVVSTQGSVVQQGTLNYNGSSAVINLSPVVASGVYVLHFSNGTQAKLVKQ